MFINNVSQIGKNVPKEIYFLSKRFWPGPLTIIYKEQGYRIPKNPFLLKIISKLGPLWSSSANISGETEIKNLLDIKNKFKNNLKDFIVVIDNTIPNGIPSTIYSYDEKKILREGPIKKEEIFS